MNDEALLIPIVAILMPLVLVPTILFIKHAHRKREMTHRERMKALESNRSIPGDHGWVSLACIALGAVTPVGALLCAWLASMTSHGRTEEAWFCAMIVGVTGIGCGTRLLSRLLDRRDAQVPPPPAPDHDQALAGYAMHEPKPSFDPDAFDVAGRRG